MKDKLKVIAVFHYTRCGSTVLADSLSKNDFLSLGEIFNKDTYDAHKVLNKQLSIREFIESNAFDSLVEKLKTDAIIFEITTYDLYIHKANSSDVLKLLNHINSKYELLVVHLRRANPFDRLISSKLSEKTNLFHSTQIKNEKQFTEKIELDLDITQVKQGIKNNLFDIALFTHCFIKFNTIDLYYESHVSTKLLNTVNSVRGFFSLDKIQEVDEEKSQYKKLPNHSERIANYDSLVKELHKTEFSYLVEKHLKKH